MPRLPPTTVPHVRAEIFIREVGLTFVGGPSPNARSADVAHLVADWNYDHPAEIAMIRNDRTIRRVRHRIERFGYSHSLSSDELISGLEQLGSKRISHLWLPEPKIQD
jgi:hypothetical protein